jgi:LysR family transcriptional regulator of abg operon
MKLNALRALILAIDTGSLRSAAKKLGVSQPALTKMVREMEAELGAPLLERSTTGVIPTAQGKILYARASAATRELDEAAQQIGQMGGRMVGELSVGAVPLALLMLIPEAVRTFSADYPAIMLQLREELYVEQLTQLHQRAVDVVVGPIPKDMRPGECHIEKLMSIEMVVVVRRGNNALARATSLKQLSDARWVYTSLSGHTGYVRTLFERHDLPAPPPAAIVNSTLGLLSLISHGDCLGLMPRPIATHPAAAPYLSIVPLEEGPLVLHVGAMVRSEAMLKPMVRKFLVHLHRAAAHTATTSKQMGLS